MKFSESEFHPEGYYVHKLLNEKEAAQYLGLSREELQKLVQNKKLRAYKIGGQFLRFDPEDLSRFKIELVNVSDKRRQRENLLFSRIKDYFYYNDFYIIIAILIVVLLALVFKASF